ncbi:N-acyl-D-amino-acid deacylase family protein [Polymorphobacter sp.]|uniref:N-acyl-D-amino-acid deacylase family protein n=1 Tax=Polymorphobacter sp. TaxID=1909290 RepID=UPI003F7051EF
MKHDLIIRGGTVVDGTGAPPYVADIAIKNGLIAAIGRIPGTAIREIDATGHIVTPGFVDIHSHYDGQITWDNHLSPSSGHGVTTVLLGNCGVGFAPCKPDQHDIMIDVMEGIEDIPGIVMAEGIPWGWETFPQFLDFLDTRRIDVDFAILVPHIPVRVYVMGDRAVDLEAATPDDIARMAALVGEGMAAGALGFSTSRALGHRTASGEVAPSTFAGEDELQAMARELHKAGHGMFCVATDFAIENGTAPEFELLRRIAATSGQTVMFPILQHNEAPDRWQIIADATADARAQGLDMLGQVVGRPVGVLYGLETSSHPFSGCPSFQPLIGRPHAEQVAAMRDPAMRARLLSEEPQMEDARVLKMARSFHEMFRMGTPPNYSPPLSERLDHIAAAHGLTPAEVAYDIMLEDDGHGLIYHPARNFAQGNLDTVRDMLTRPETILGLADGGAHLGRICDASMPTFMLTYWARDRGADALDLATLVRAMTLDTARVAGLHDRGVIRPGYKADLNVIDMAALTLHAPRASFDLPAGGRRLTQAATGYRCTIVSGIVTHENGIPSGQLPGRLLRGTQPGPSRKATA